MIHCFLTGVRFPMEEAFVLNRREARALLAALNDRLSSLRRVIEQLAPLDDFPVPADSPALSKRPQAHRRHRLVCKAIAETLGAAFPETDLFIGWLDYQSKARGSTLQQLRGHRRFGNVIAALDDATLAAADRLAQAALRLLDPHRCLPKKTRLAIAAATCARHRGCSAAQVEQVIRAAADGRGDLDLAGLATHELAAIRRHLAPTADDAAACVGATSTPRP